MISNGLPSVFRDIYNQSFYRQDEAIRRLYNSTKDSQEYLQRLGLYKQLKVHKGCVNTVCWNDKGQYLLSGSDDQTIVVTNPYNQNVLVQYKTAHRANIFSAKFMPHSNDRGIVSCSGDGIVLYTELTAANIQTPKNEANLNYFNCHSSGTTYEVMTIPTESNSFMSCGEDGTVRLFDLRQISSCHKTCCKDNILILSPSAITAMSLSPISHNYIAVGSSDSLIRIYDRRYLSLIDFSLPGEPTDKHTVPVKAFTIPASAKRPFRVTSIKYSPDETELLVSYSSDYLYLFDISKEGIDVKTFKDKSKAKKKSNVLDSPPPVRKLRLRGDWSDTGPEARPEREAIGRVEIGQVRPQLHGPIMHRMTEVLSRMLADNRSRLGIMPHLNETVEDNVLFVNATQEFADLTERHSADEAGPQPIPSTSSGITYGNSINIHQESISDFDSDDETDCDISMSARAHVEANTLKEELSKMEVDSKKAAFDYVKMKFMGHRNARTMIKEATFWGNDYVMSGSDCGHVFTWNRHTGKLVMLMEADQHVVNCLQPHPTLPFLATSGIDYDIKVWAPVRDQNSFDEEKAKNLMERNAVMLEETKDTITVPAAFMIRMLACIHTLRNRRAFGNGTSNKPNNSNENQPSSS